MLIGVAFFSSQMINLLEEVTDSLNSQIISIFSREVFQ
jgi:hypothetical protein